MAFAKGCRQKAAARLKAAGCRPKAAGGRLRAPRFIKVGTDFSGMDAAAVAFKDLGVLHKLMFASDRHEPCRKLVTRLHKPAKFFDDVLWRAPEEEDYVDTYVWGPPCQSFSTAGKSHGVQEQAATPTVVSFLIVNALLSS